MFAPRRSATERRRVAHLCLAVLIAFAGLAAVVLYRFPPTVYGFYPQCPVFEYLHLQCPGCGTTRAMAALLHGHLHEALRLNALAIGFVLPVSAGYGAIAYVQALRGDHLHWPQVPRPAIYASVGVILGFTVLRNL